MTLVKRPGAHVGTKAHKQLTHQLHRADWQERTAVVIAAGPSLTVEDCALVRAARERDEVRVVSVSNAWKHCATWADAFFSADRRYWKHYLPQMLKAGAPKARMVTTCNLTEQQDGITRVRMANRPGLGLAEVYTGGNSGYMGINLAYLYGARRIVLLGLDCQPGPNGERHFDGDHPAPLTQHQPFGEWVKRFKTLAEDCDKRGVEVINCSRRTALQCFKRGDLAEVLNAIDLHS